MKARSSALPVATVNPLRPDHMNPISARSALSPARRLAAAAFGLAVVAIVGACGEGSGSTCATCDTGRPVVTLSETVDHRLVDRALHARVGQPRAAHGSHARQRRRHRRRLRHDVHERRDVGRHSVHDSDSGERSHGNDHHRGSNGNGRRAQRRPPRHARVAHGRAAAPLR